MAQTVILASAQGAATSTDVVIGAAGAGAILQLFTAAGPLPPNITLGIYRVANAIEMAIGALTYPQPLFVLPGPGTYRVKRNDITAYGINVGVVSDLSDATSLAGGNIGLIGSVLPIPNAGNGGTGLFHHLVAAGTTNATLVKAGASLLAVAVLVNPSAAAKFVKLFNGVAAPVPGTDTPVMSVLVPAGQTVSPNLGPFAMRFTLGLGYCITNLPADLDATAVAAGDVIVSLAYA